MSFLYPRTIDVLRQVADTTVGAIDYQSAEATKETLILQGIRASIQFDRAGQRNPVGLPSDVKGQPTWRILIPKRDAGLGSILSGDVIKDDLCVRYQVYAPYWNSLGFGCRAVVLEP